MAPSKLIRWATILSDYQYKIIHKKGTLIPHADALSRLPSSELVVDSESLFTYLNTPLVSIDEVSRESVKNQVLSIVMEFVRKVFPKVVPNEVKVYAKIQ